MPDSVVSHNWIVAIRRGIQVGGRATPTREGEFAMPSSRRANGFRTIDRTPAEMPGTLFSKDGSRHLARPEPSLLVPNELQTKPANQLSMELN